MPLIQQLYSPDNMLEQIMSAAVFLTIAVMWIATMMLRSQNKRLRQTVMFMGVLVVGWVLTRTVRRQIDVETTFARYLWYSYYIFETLLPITVLRTATLIGVGGKNRRMPKWLLWITAFNIVLFLLVITNDLHGLMFSMDLSSPGWSQKINYGYGVVYYVAFSAMFLEWIIGVVISFYKVKDSPRRAGVALMLVVIFAIGFYKVGYGVRIPIFVDSDVTMVTCTFTLLFFELCMRFGQIPVNTHYRELFQRTGHDLHITDNDGAPVFISNNAQCLTADVWKELKNSPTPIYADESTLLHKNKITGGYAVWREDLTAINKLRGALEATNSEIEAANLTLSNTVQTKEHAAQAKARAELYAALEKDTAGHEQRLDRMLRALPAEGSLRAVHMGVAALLVCSIKRQSQLLIYKMSGNETVSPGDMLVYLDELGEYANLAGVECLISCQLESKLDTRYALLFYSFFHDLLEWSAINAHKKVITQLASDNGRVMMKLLLPPEGMEYTAPDKVVMEAAAIGGLIEKKELDGMAGIWFSFPESGESHG